MIQIFSLQGFFQRKLYIYKPNSRFMNNTKEHILQTSLLLFMQKSYRDVTMKEIVEKTGMSKGAFYHYFKSKEELFKEITYLFFSMGAVDYSVFDQQSLDRFYHQYLEHIGASFKKISQMTASADNKQASLNFFLILFEAISRFPEFLEIELEQYKQEVKNWETVIHNARINGEIHSESTDREIADLFLYCTDGVFIRFVNQEKNSSYQAELKKSFDTVYNNVKT